jgi:glyoxylase-like metal-dependent hydrolase (beta-lactamase superfamily II)/ferredoxin
MADQAKRLSTNVAGSFFVDATCINCDTCRQLAPLSFREIGDYSAVVEQPVGDGQIQQAYQALLACPVGSIGTVHMQKDRLAAAKSSFPVHLDGGVYYTGFNSEKSFGANSFFIEHPDGNWLIDSPRYLKQLEQAFERRGGVKYIFLTHEDDVADAARYARRFKATRLIHRADAEAARDAEWLIEGGAATRVAPQFTIVPVPGHTPGSMALLYDEKFLFTGDHLWWDPESRTLECPERLVWSGRHLHDSIAKLLHFPFEWVLAGHGDRIRLPVADMHEHIRALLVRRGALRNAAGSAGT